MSTKASHTQDPCLHETLLILTKCALYALSHTGYCTRCRSPTKSIPGLFSLPTQDPMPRHDDLTSTKYRELSGGRRHEAPVDDTGVQDSVTALNFTPNQPTFPQNQPVHATHLTRASRATTHLTGFKRRVISKFLSAPASTRMAPRGTRLGAALELSATSISLGPASFGFPAFLPSPLVCVFPPIFLVSIASLLHPLSAANSLPR